MIKHSEWKETKFTLHLLSQILGKIKLKTAPQQPQWGHVTLPITAEGFSTGLLFYHDRFFQIDLSISQAHIIMNVDGNLHTISITEQKSIKQYYDEIFSVLHEDQISLTINTIPQEMPYTTKFNEDDTPREFDQEKALRGLKLLQFAYHQELTFISPYRCRKLMPALFWGTFDISTLILHGKMAPFSEDKVIEKAAFDEHFIEFGFWLGDDDTDDPSFFILPYPFQFHPLENESDIEPEAAYYDANASEFFYHLNQENDMNSSDIQAFFHSAYNILTRELEWQGCSYYEVPLEMPPQL
ncbi:DUF5996 family protein [Jeotgalibacillus salarius]|uniref:DUF5996 family protein n=1 Tax=Jeotgalibacillus salarius TaxID=546023 RepID=UPI001FC8E96C|nr:DUF5996 family protein [Jeotgalibacillus salarius]